MADVRRESAYRRCVLWAAVTYLLVWHLEFYEFLIEAPRRAGVGPREGELLKVYLHYLPWLVVPSLNEYAFYMQVEAALAGGVAALVAWIWWRRSRA